MLVFRVIIKQSSHIYIDESNESLNFCLVHIMQFYTVTIFGKLKKLNRKHFYSNGCQVLTL